jgi:hypothetical protein
MVLVCGTDTWYWSVVLVYDTGTWYWYVVLVHGTGMWYWYMVLVHGTGMWYWYHQRQKHFMFKNFQDKSKKQNYSVIL